MGKLLKRKSLTPGDHREVEAERRLEAARFHVYKFNKREVPKDNKQKLIISCFSEFGCETIGVLYCLPKIVYANPGLYKIAVGWYGREYLYRHLVDEYWEMPEEYQWLREYCRAFHYDSVNLARIEKHLAKMGRFISTKYMGNICLGNTCKECKNFWGDVNYVTSCPKCNSKDVVRSIFGDVPKSRKQKHKLPRPAPEVMARAAEYLKPHSVGVFARNRKAYGRNLPAEFYVRLIEYLQSKGYNPVWMGEKQSTLPCPVPGIVDFSRLPESRDLELTLAITAQLDFTVQFWTASTRLAAMVGTPYLLFESPDQICGKGQEGIRMALTTESFDKKKLVFCHYLKVLNDQQAGIELVDRAITEMQAGNWEDIIGLVDHKSIVELQARTKNLWGKL